MVNQLVLLLALVTIVLWLLQEIRGRAQMHDALSWIAKHKQTDNPVALVQQATPAWWNWTYKLLQAAWFAWFGAVLFVKDGDFALVLVVLTLMAGLIAGLDKYLFQRRREVFVGMGNVAIFITHFVSGEAERLKQRFSAALPIAQNAREFFPILLVVVVLRSFIYEPFQIPSPSMVPTLKIGDYILVNKYAYGLRLPVTGTKILDVGEPERGDVMVFYPPHDSRYFIKRVIGLPGDHIEYRNKVLRINGKLADQKVLATLPPGEPKVKVIEENLDGVDHLSYHYIHRDFPDFEVTVSPGHYFMMGDNRDNSADSRMWGEVPEQNIVGKAVAVWLHWPSMGQLPEFKAEAIR